MVRTRSSITSTKSLQEKYNVRDRYQNHLAGPRLPSCETRWRVSQRHLSHIAIVHCREARFPRRLQTKYRDDGRRTARWRQGSAVNIILEVTHIERSGVLAVAFDLQGAVVSFNAHPGALV